MLTSLLSIDYMTNLSCTSLLSPPRDLADPLLTGNNCIFDTSESQPWFPASFPPLAIFYGTRDTLVLGKPLVERIRNNEPNVRLLKAVALEDYEHLGSFASCLVSCELANAVR